MKVLIKFDSSQLPLSFNLTWATVLH